MWEWMGPGGLHGLQIRWRASFDVRGGFDSLALPPCDNREWSDKLTRQVESLALIGLRSGICDMQC